MDKLSKMFKLEKDVENAEKTLLDEAARKHDEEALGIENKGGK